MRAARFVRIDRGAALSRQYSFSAATAASPEGGVALRRSISSQTLPHASRREMSRASEHLAELRAAQRAAALDAATRSRPPPPPVPTPNLAPRRPRACRRRPSRCAAAGLRAAAGLPRAAAADPRVLAAMAAQAAAASGAPVLAPLHQSPHLNLPPGLAAVRRAESRYRPSFLILRDI